MKIDFESILNTENDNKDKKSPWSFISETFTKLM